MKQLLSVLSLFILCSCASSGQQTNPSRTKMIQKKVVKTEAEWRTSLTPLQYAVLREKATERPGSGEYNDYKMKTGMFCCAGCGNPLFDAATKFDSGTGWPSFYNYATDTSLVDMTDDKYGMVRTEVICARCDGHLGHVFDDGPQPTGLRYCINSVSIVLKDE